MESNNEAGTPFPAPTEKPVTDEVDLRGFIALPSGISVQVRGMTGREEDLFTDQAKIKDGRAINHTIHNCCERIFIPGVDEQPRKPEYNEIATAMLTADRVALMLEVRRVTYGNEIKGQIKCTSGSCHELIDFNVSLNGLERHPRTIDDFTQEGAHLIYEVRLKDGTRVKCRPIIGQDEQTIAKTQSDGLLTAAMGLHVVQITLSDGTKVEANDKKRWLQNASVVLRQELREEIEKWSLGYDTRFDVTCQSCGNSTVGSMEQLPGFFLPSRLTPMVI